MATPDVDGLYFLDDPNEFLKTSLADWKVNPPTAVDWTKKQYLSGNMSEDTVMYMAEGMDDLAIQYSMGAIDAVTGQIDWIDGDFVSSVGSFPRALKFSFTLYDSRGIIEKGKRFTHIVYIGD